MAHRTFLCGAILSFFSFLFFFCRSAVHTTKVIIYRSRGGLSLLVEPTIDCLPTAYYFKFMFSFHFYLMQFFSAVATILKEKKYPPKNLKTAIKSTYSRKRQSGLFVFEITKYRGSPTYTIITNTASTNMVFGICTYK